MRACLCVGVTPHGMLARVLMCVPPHAEIDALTRVAAPVAIKSSVLEVRLKSHQVRLAVAPAEVDVYAVFTAAVTARLSLNAARKCTGSCGSNGFTVDVLPHFQRQWHNCNAYHGFRGVPHALS